ncbi:hypothetical protein [uncultured Pseudokineococcus sp.]|uniref:hypothetical protein n=1 Tax=uncultured Pseudokineococcus sp. TaxID=1642928 RepID=UPI00261B0B77|nr:hypothetical protein [uncultured Pseudokineococcus sp.]
MSAASVLGRGAEVVVPVAVAGWCAVTVVSQHPNRAFDRFRGGVLTSALLPNWRFFAPEPAMHDFRLLHRCLREDGTQTTWEDTHDIAPRTWQNAFWFPERRRDKALIDLCNELLTHVQQMSAEDLPGTIAYQLLRRFVAREVRAREALQPGGAPVVGLQFLVVRDAGHDEEPDPEYLLVSRFEEIAATAPGSAAARTRVAERASSPAGPVPRTTSRPRSAAAGTTSSATDERRAGGARPSRVVTA